MNNSAIDKGNITHFLTGKSVRFIFCILSVLRNIYFNDVYVSVAVCGYLHIESHVLRGQKRASASSGTRGAGLCESPHTGPCSSRPSDLSSPECTNHFPRLPAPLINTCLGARNELQACLLAPFSGKHTSKGLELGRHRFL